MSDFTAGEVRLGEALYRCEGHCLAACELYVIGRAPDALLQAARPITDVLPWLETELRSCASLGDFMVSVSQMGAQIRKVARPRYLRRAHKRVERARASLLEEAANPSAGTDPYSASVALVLLGNGAERYRNGVAAGELGEYHSAYGMVRVAQALLRSHRTAETELESELGLLSRYFPSVEPPAGLIRPETLDASVERVAELAASQLDAREFRWRLADSLAHVDRMLDDVFDNYRDGVRPLAARLAASLFVRSYDPVRSELSTFLPDTEDRLTTRLAVDLRRDINRGAPLDDVRSLVEEIKGLLDDARTSLDRAAIEHAARSEDDEGRRTRERTPERLSSGR
jgi:hypothetical protein